MWLQRKLTIHGRATVIGSLLLSRCWYTLMSQTIPDDVMNEIRHLCIIFLWNGAHLIKYDTVIGKKQEGGLNIPDINFKRQ